MEDTINFRLQKLEQELTKSLNKNTFLINQSTKNSNLHTTFLKSLASKDVYFEGYSQVLLSSAGGTAVKADSDCTIQIDPEHRQGWNCTNDVAGTKFNLYYFNGAQEILTLGSIKSIYFKAFINNNSEASSIPHFHIYTKPTGSGDEQPWYHSKIDYTFDYLNSNQTIGIGEECVFYAINEPLTDFSVRYINFENKTVNGDGRPEEEILYIVLGSDSGASQDALNVTVNLLGFNTFDGVSRRPDLRRNLILYSESSIGGAATREGQSEILQSIDSMNSKITTGSEDTLESAQQVVIYGRKDTSPTGLRALKTSDNGSVHIKSTTTFFTKTSETLTLPSNGTVSSDEINTKSNDSFGVTVTSTNNTDPIELYSSNDNATYYPTGIKGTNGIFYHEINHPSFQYYKIYQTDTTASAGTINLIVSKR